MGESVKTTGSVQRGRFIIFFRNILQSGDEEQHIKSDGPPDGDAGNRRHGQGGILEPSDVGPSEEINYSEVRIEYPNRCVIGNTDWQNIRQEETCQDKQAKPSQSDDQ